MGNSSKGGDGHETQRPILADDACGIPESMLPPAGEACGFIEYYKHIPYEAEFIRFPRRQDYQYTQKVQAKIIKPHKDPALKSYDFKKRSDGSTVSKRLLLSEIDHGMARSGEDSRWDEDYEPLDWSNWLAQNESLPETFLAWTEKYKKITGAVNQLYSTGILCDGDLRKFVFINGGYDKNDDRDSDEIEEDDNFQILNVTDTKLCHVNHFEANIMMGGNICGRPDTYNVSDEVDFELGEIDSKAVELDCIWFQPDGYKDIRNCFSIKRAIPCHAGAPTISQIPIIVKKTNHADVPVSPDNWNLLNLNLDFIEICDQYGEVLLPSEAVIYLDAGDENTVHVTEEMDFGIYSIGRIKPGSLRVLDVGYPGYTDEGEGGIQYPNVNGYQGPVELVEGEGADYSIPSYGCIVGQIDLNIGLKFKWKSVHESTRQDQYMITGYEVSNGYLLLNAAATEIIRITRNGEEDESWEFDFDEPKKIPLDNLVLDEVIEVEYKWVRPICVRMECEIIDRSNENMFATWRDELIAVANECKIVKYTKFTPELVGYGAIRFNAGLILYTPYPPVEPSYFLNAGNGKYPAFNGTELTRPVYITSSGVGGIGHKGQVPGKFQNLYVVDEYYGEVIPFNSIGGLMVLCQYGKDIIKKVTARVQVNNMSFHKQTCTQGDESHVNSGAMAFRDTLYQPGEMEGWDAEFTDWTEQSIAEAQPKLACKIVYTQKQEIGAQNLKLKLTNCMNYKEGIGGGIGGCEIGKAGLGGVYSSWMYHMSSSCKYRHPLSQRDGCGYEETGGGGVMFDDNGADSWESAEGYFRSHTNDFGLHALEDNFPFGRTAHTAVLDPFLFYPYDEVGDHPEYTALGWNLNQDHGIRCGISLAGDSLGNTRVISKWHGLFDGEGKAIAEEPITDPDQIIDFDITEAIVWMIEHINEHPNFGLYFCSHFAVDGTQPTDEWMCYSQRDEAESFNYAWSYEAWQDLMQVTLLELAVEFKKDTKMVEDQVQEVVHYPFIQK